MKSTKKAVKAKEKVKKLRKNGATGVLLVIRKEDGKKEKYIVKKLEVKITTEQHAKEIRFQTYKAGEKGTYQMSDYVKMKLETIKSMKIKKIKSKKVKKEPAKTPAKKK